MHRIEHLIQAIQEKNNPFVKALYIVAFLPLIIRYSLINSYYLLFSNSYTSFSKVGSRSLNGEYTTSYYEHKIIKKKARIFSFSSVGIVIISVLIINIISIYI